LRDVYPVNAQWSEIMKMSELILAVGDENVIFQNLLNDTQSIYKTKHGTKITFYTGAIQAEELMDGGKPKNMGLVLWLPKSRVDAVVAAEKVKKPNEIHNRDAGRLSAKVERLFTAEIECEERRPFSDALADKIDDLLERHQGAMTKSQYAAAASEIRALIDEAVAKGRDLENEGCAVLVESAAGNNLGNLMAAFDFEDYLKPNLQALLAAISASIRAWSAKQLALILTTASADPVLQGGDSEPFERN
jgi:hypothetical protein